MPPSPISPDDLHRIFKNLDKNNKGHVSTHELHRLLELVGIRTTLDELEKYVGRETLNFIDFLFFYEAMVESSKTAERKQQLGEGDYNNDINDHHENDLFEAFKVFDLNGDGYISSEELESVLSRLGWWDQKTGKKDGKDMIGAYDENSDGVLDFGEFKNMMMSGASTSDSDT
ncbi:calcium-binding EF-hand family protein [Striga asiatica]|uniref:Calcium-binding EF-hand family protein n=1 Tax=Striga asiatica TaxID=4170 RepID=A0A5A7QYU2_STRAF|nr:calcium-binding EF-hand family protein [Striga asiatica]